MHRIVSPFILQQYQNHQTQGDLTTASLFVDISGFSKIMYALMRDGQHGAEKMAHIMRAIFDPLVDAIYAHQGFITVFAGDAFTALFPPQPHETDLTLATHRALAAGWFIRQSVADHPHYTTNQGVFDVGVKVGLAVGDCRWQIIHAPDNDKHATFYFRGTAIDSAANAEKDADKNWMVITPAAHRWLAPSITTIAAGNHQKVMTITTDLPAPQPINLPPVNQDALTAFFPQAIITATHTGEFRHIVNLFISVQGNQLTDDQVIQFGQTLLILQEKYGGVLNRIDFGDKGCNALLFWGAPVAYENDAHRALNFMLDLQAQTPLTIRAGITRQIAHAGIIGSALQGEFTCYGNGVNLAARFMMAAPWDAIWLDSALTAKASGEFEIDEVGAQLFKGFAEPQMVYRLAERKGFVARLYEHEMVGREQEKQQLRTFIESILDPARKQRFAGIMTVMGEAGMGKSRLVSEVQIKMADQGGIQFALGQTDQTIRSPFNPFTYWLRNYFGYLTTQSTAQNKDAFNRKLDQLIDVTTDETLAKTLRQGRAALGSLIPLRWQNSAYEQLPPEGRYEWRLATLKALLLAESLQTPLLIILEDIHWLDPDSITFIERLVRQIEPYPLAIVATTRPVLADKPLLGDAAYQQIDLTQINQTDMAQLITQLLTGRIAPSLLALINQRAEGNPFFGEQIALYLQQQQAIIQQAGEWQLAQRDDKRYLPQDIRTIFIARLDQLATKLKQIVQTAAILGREFELQILREMLSSTPELSTQTERLETEAIWIAMNQLRYLFKHALLRDAAYEMQVQAQRTQLHQLAAATMEQLYATDLSAHYEAIAEHYLAAYQQGSKTVADKAVHYLQATAEQFSEASEHQRVVAMVAEALTILETQRGGEATIKRQYELLLLQETSYNRLGQRDKQAEVHKHLLALTTSKPAWQLEVYLRQIQLSNNIGTYEAGVAQAETAFALAQQLDDQVGEAAVAIAWGALVQRQSKYEPAIKLAERGIALAETAGRLDLVAKGLIVLGDSVEEQGQYETAITYYTRSLTIREKLGDKRGVAKCLNNLGIIASMQGQYETAIDYHNRTFAIKEESGDRHGVAMSLNNLGIVARGQGHYQTATDHLSRALTIQEEIGDRRGVAISLNNLGHMASIQGSYNTAATYLTRALAIQKEIGNQDGFGMSLINLGNVLYAQGSYALAVDYLTRALSIYEELGNQQLIAYALTGLGKVTVSLEQLTAGINHLERAVALRESLGYEVLLMESLAALAWAHWQADDKSAALATVERVESYLAAGNDFEDSEYGWENGWLCYQILAGLADERAQERLAAVYAGVMAEADKIKDETTRTKIVENIPWHRKIIAAYKK